MAQKEFDIRDFILKANLSPGAVSRYVRCISSPGLKSLDRYCYPKHVGKCLKLAESSVRNYLEKMNKKQAIHLKNSDVRDKDIWKLFVIGQEFYSVRSSDMK